MVSIEESEHLELGTGCAAEGWGIVIISSLRMSCQGRGGRGRGGRAAMLSRGQDKKTRLEVCGGGDDSRFGQQCGLQAILFDDPEHILKSGLGGELRLPYA